MKAYIITTKDNKNRYDGIINYPSCFPMPLRWYGPTPDEVDVPLWFISYNKDMLCGADPRRVYCCNLAKLYVAEYHFKNYPDEDLLMMEDDVFFTNDAEKKYVDFIREVPSNWNFLFLGGEHVNSKKYTPNLIAPGVLRCDHVIGNEAFIIRAKAVEKYIIHMDLNHENPYGYCDWHLIELQKLLPTYAPLGFIAGQKDGWSVVQQAYLYKGIQKEFWYNSKNWKTLYTN